MSCCRARSLANDGRGLGWILPGTRIHTGSRRDNLRDNWAYRDWVIRALNDDMPFDQFTIEQIAGDLLPDATESQKIATGFHRCAPTNVEAGSLPEETRIEQVIDRVNTTGAVWLGTTLECCQCHDHKYDPFTSKEYYQLLAFFNSTVLEADRTNPQKASSIQFKGPTMNLSDPERDQQRERLNQKLSSLREQKRLRRSQLSQSLQQWVTDGAIVIDDVPQIHPMEIIEFESLGTTDSSRQLDDQSVLLVGGDPPDTDVYTIRTRVHMDDIRAFRLDALRDESLPGGGPGRGDPKRRNFVLTEFSAAWVSKKSALDSKKSLGVASRSASERLTFETASASFSQKNWDVAEALTAGKQSGWAISPKFDQSHWARFVLEKPLSLREDDEIVFTLKQHWGQARTIGRLRLSAVTGDLEAESIPSEIVSIVQKRPRKWSPKDRKALLDYRVTLDQPSQELDASIAELTEQVTLLAPDTTLVMVELDQPRMSTVFERGDYQKPGEPVSPGAPSVLHSMPDGPPNRLTLARWLVAAENPLVARVTVNRWWAELFGKGLVTTPEDFGIKGDAPSHPQLLDWLASEFVASGWSMKHVLKTIVLSATYQQSSTISSQLLEFDDQNTWLARGPRFRMDAEMIRDNALSIAGLLDLKQFGPPIRPYQPAGVWKKVGGTSYQYEVSPGSEQHRRGLYVVLKRGSPYPSFMNFDCHSSTGMHDQTVTNQYAATSVNTIE